MTPEQKDALRIRNQERGLRCGGCGALSLEVRDGAAIGGFPGVRYRACGGCGWSRAITERPRRARLR